MTYAIVGNVSPAVLAIQFFVEEKDVVLGDVHLKVRWYIERRQSIISTTSSVTYFIGIIKTKLLILFMTNADGM